MASKRPTYRKQHKRGTTTQPRRYAAGTSVTTDRSRTEVEKLLKCHGATGFICAWDDEADTEVLMCRIQGRMLRFNVTKPQIQNFMYTEQGRPRMAALAEKARMAEYRRRWRALLLLVKAKLEAIAAEVSTFDREFLADMCLSTGDTVGQWMGTQLDAVYMEGKMPLQLPGIIQGS